jgi:hypothetical protein
MIKKVVAGVAGDDSRLGLTVRDFVESWENSDGVDCSSTTEKSTVDDLEALSAAFVEVRRRVGGSMLEFLAMNRLKPLMGSMLSRF